MRVDTTIADLPRALAEILKFEQKIQNGGQDGGQNNFLLAFQRWEMLSLYFLPVKTYEYTLDTKIVGLSRVG